MVARPVIMQSLLVGLRKPRACEEARYEAIVPVHGLPLMNGLAPGVHRGIREGRSFNRLKPST